MDANANKEDALFKSQPEQGSGILQAGDKIEGPCSTPIHTNRAEGHDDKQSGYREPVYYVDGQVLRYPFVDVSDLKLHLALLRGFRDLRTTIEEGEDPRIKAMDDGMDGKERWEVYVHLAVERFQKWLTVENIGISVPPLDVIMVWHAYMLHPFWYAEDCTRVGLLWKLRKFDGRFIALLRQLGDINNYKPTNEVKGCWEEDTGTAFYLLDALPRMPEHKLECPGCCAWTSVPFIAENGTGYAQPNFRAKCTKCAHIITKESLAALKLMNNILASSIPNVNKYGGLIAGTVYLVDDDYQSRKVKIGLQRDPAIKDLAVGIHDVCKVTVAKILKRQGYTKEAMRRTLESLTGVEWAEKILSAYNDDRPFSVDLSGAVLRQCSFVDKMHKLGWTNPERFKSPQDEIVLVHAAVRYHAFLDLMSSMGGTEWGPGLVPTLDIDLVWHTHQLMEGAYHNVCRERLGRYVDHDDTVEEGDLSKAFKKTCKAWEDRFHIPYTHCGCPDAGARFIRHIASVTAAGIAPGVRIIGINSNPGENAQKAYAEALLPPPHPDSLAATHVSEHDILTQTNRAAQFKKPRSISRFKNVFKTEHQEGACEHFGLEKQDGAQTMSGVPASEFVIGDGYLRPLSEDNANSEWRATDVTEYTDYHWSGCDANMNVLVNNDSTTAKKDLVKASTDPVNANKNYVDASTSTEPEEQRQVKDGSGAKPKPTSTVHNKGNNAGTRSKRNYQDAADGGGAYGGHASYGGSTFDVVAVSVGGYGGCAGGSGGGCAAASCASGGGGCMSC